jgi:AraC family transcriptional regulator
MLREKADCCGNAFDACVDISDPHMTVAALLTSALGHLSGDPAAAKRCVEQAAELLGNRTTGLRPNFAVHTGIVCGGLAPWQIKQLRVYIAENLASSIAIESLAAICRLSGSHFSRAFKASFGEPPHSYVMRQRIQEAKRLMLECEKPLSQIALACGFADQSHFCRSFRRTEGDSPNLWRRQRASGFRMAVAD